MRLAGTSRSDTPGTVPIVSRPRNLDLPAGSTRIDLETARGRFAAIVAERVAAEQTAASKRSAALLVGGFTGSKEDFVSIIGPMRDAGRRVIAMDMRGQYESVGAEDPASYAVEALATDLLSVADSLGEPVHLVGHSFGGFVARAAAARGGPEIRSVTLMDSGPGRITGSQILNDLGLLKAALASIDMVSLWELKRSLELSRGDVDPPEPVATFMRDRFVQTHPQSLLEAAAELLEHVDRVEPLVDLALPVLVLYGSGEDVWEPAALAAMAQRLDARHVVIEGAGHSPAVDDPDATAAALTAFWNDVDATV